ncbi:MAG: HD domain-containing protein [Firmicutes bacterium]|nr:HD domain-containing protein [Bacillota bacterium]
MKRLNDLIFGEEYQKYLDIIKHSETDRIFCGHDTEHFLAVSRLLYIYCLESGINIDKELIYAVGFLHDIGRARQYLDGTEHHRASADIAAELMPKYGFNSEETELVCNMILAHRDKNADGLGALVYKADKASRNCFDCAAAIKCNWSAEKRNLRVEI